MVKLHNFLKRSIPLFKVSLIEGVDLAVLRDLDIGLWKNEFSKGLIEGEDVDTISKSQGQESRGGVQTVSGSNQVGSGLKGMKEMNSACLDGPMNFSDNKDSIQSPNPISTSMMLYSELVPFLGDYWPLASM